MTGTVQPPAVHTTAEKLAELHARLELAKEPGGEKAAAKRDKKGIPSARARVHALVDPGTFLEIGALAKTPNDPNALYGDGVVTGHAMIDGRPVELTPTEFDLLRTLMENPGHAFTRLALIEQGLGYAYDGMERTLDSHIRNLRRKIEPDSANPTYIKTVFGVGYRMLGPE